MLLALAPGLRVVRRGRDHLQVGLYDDPRLLLPRSETTLRVLDHVLDQRHLDEAEPGVADVVSRLVESGCASRRRDVQARARRRSATRVAVLGHLDPDPAPLLVGSGLTRCVGSGGEADVVLVLSRGEIERERLDDLLRRRVPHLLVRTVDGGAVVGPFVEPGRTACLRCIDAHLSLGDPDHLPVLTRYVTASQRPRGDGSEEVAEPVLGNLAIAWAVRDLLAHVDGERPTTWSRTVRLGPAPSRQVQTAWSRHPECGCCWPGGAPT
jgi:bacteriocin biosynthesis cyclodehydratase domain-containing protein